MGHPSSPTGFPPLFTPQPSGAGGSGSISFWFPSQFMWGLCTLAPLDVGCLRLWQMRLFFGLHPWSQRQYESVGRSVSLVAASYASILRGSVELFFSSSGGSALSIPPHLSRRMVPRLVAKELFLPTYFSSYGSSLLAPQKVFVFLGPPELVTALAPESPLQ